MTRRKRLPTSLPMHGVTKIVQVVIRNSRLCVANVRDFFLDSCNVVML